MLWFRIFAPNPFWRACLELEAVNLVGKAAVVLRTAA
jgi:hypothetical protein